MKHLNFLSKSGTLNRGCTQVNGSGMDRHWTGNGSVKE